MLQIFFRQYIPKARSLPNPRTISRYVHALAILLFFLFIYNFINITVVADGFPIIIPEVSIVIVPITFLVVYHQIEREWRNIEKRDMKKIVMLIQLGHAESLRRELQERPEVLNQKYKNKSLISWAKFYNNLEAHSIITKSMSSRLN